MIRLHDVTSPPSRVRTDDTVPQLHDGEWRASAPAADAGNATFVFAGIAGYTAVTEAHGDEQAADLVGRLVPAR